MPVVLLVAAVLLSFVLVLSLVVAWLPVTLLASPVADATPVASANAGTNSPTSSLVLNAFIIHLLCRTASIVSLDDETCG
jgi:hypothetical protein